MTWQKRPRRHGDTELLLAALFVAVFLALCCLVGAGLL